MANGFIIGLDFGSESARGVLIDAETGEQAGLHIHPYAHGIIDGHLPDGTPLPPGWSLQDAGDYAQAARAILTALGKDRRILSIGLDFTASSPLPVAADGTPLSALHPREPHAYVKLYKHQAAQPQADAISARHAALFADFGGRISGEWLIAKAAQMREEAPALWAATARFIEGGDWMVWQLTGHEARSYGFATYKAQYSPGRGYPGGLVEGLEERLSEPLPVGRSAGPLSDAWLARTGILGPCAVAVAVIDSHVVLPAVGAVGGGTFVGALGTSAAYLMLSEEFQPLPPGIEGVARDSSLPGLWCYEAGQPAFGDCLGWFVRRFSGADDMAAGFARLNAEAEALAPGAGRVMALDWWNGNRVPHGDAALTGLLIGLTRKTTQAEIYRALLESLCFGARHVLDLIEAGGIAVERVLMTSGLAERNPFLVQMMADVFGRDILVPDIRNAACAGAAIHGAVAAGVVADFHAGAARFGATQFTRYEPRPALAQDYDRLYRIFRQLSANTGLSDAMHALGRF